MKVNSKTMLIVLLTGVLTVAGIAVSIQAKEQENAKQAIAAKVKEMTSVDAESVEKTPIDGIYEIVANKGNIIFIMRLKTN